MIPIIHRHRGGDPESGSPPIPGVVLKKGPWSAAEDKILTEYVREHGEGNWNAVQRNTALQRCGKSCRLRWANHLRPNLKKGAFSSEEERLIIDLHSKLGNKWARISSQLPGRTDNEVKNYWNTRVKRRLRHGLPLYPHNRPSPPQQPPSPPPEPPLPVSFLDPTSLPFPPPFFSFNNPPGFLIQSSFSNLGFNPPQQTHVELHPPTPPQLDFDYKLELPSNEFCPNFAADDQDDDVDNGPKFYPNVTEARNNNSGLLDALLQESHSRAATATANNFNKQDCVDVDQWDYIYANSSTDEDGEKMEEQNEDHTYYKNEDLSSIVNLIPSVVKAPKYKNEGHGEESSNGQSTNVTEDNAKLDIPWNAECFSPSNSYTCWDNLPRIC